MDNKEIQDIQQDKSADITKDDVDLGTDIVKKLGDNKPLWFDNNMALNYARLINHTEDGLEYTKRVFNLMTELTEKYQSGELKEEDFTDEFIKEQVLNIQ